MRHSYLLALAIFLSTVAADAVGAANVGDRQNPAPVATEAAGTAPPSLAPMLARVSPAVVNISVQGIMAVAHNAIFRDPLFREFFGLPENAAPPSQRFQAAGSGVIYDAKVGYVLTNNHVVEHADKIMVTLTDRRRLEAKLVAADTQSDIAILKIPADALISLPLGESKTLHVGDYVVAIGNPFGVGQTATFGIVSALGRTGLGIEGYEDFIQTDASINPGNSGGALVDAQGRLMGMNAAIISQGGGNVGIGFAVPIDMIKSVAEQLISQGKVSRGALGVMIQDLTPALAQAMNVTVTEGALVSELTPQSAGGKAGLAAGDIITALDGERITGSAQLRNMIGQKKPGTNVRLTYIRDGQERSIAVTLDAQPADIAAERPTTPKNTMLPSGLMLGAIPRNDANFGKVKGVYVIDVDPGSLADEAGLKPGDIIITAGRISINTPDDLTRILRNQKKGVPLLLQIRRGNSSLFAAIG